MTPRHWENKFMEAIYTHTEVQKQYDMLEKELQNFTKQLPQKRKHINKYINDETKDLLLHRKELNTKKRTKEVKRELTRISKKINRNIIQQKKATRQSTFEKFISKTGGLRKAYKELNDKSEWTGNLKNKQGINLTKRPDIINEATQFYKELYTGADNTHYHFICLESNEFNGENANQEVPTILTSEIKYAIKTQKSDKTPGSDNITNETLKTLSTTLLKPLQTLFNNILRTETIPDQWSKSTIILLFKKGEKNNLSNYRPISLMSNLYKIFSKVILNRITAALEEHQPREQAGFRKRYSTIDHIQTVTQVIEKAKEYGKTIYICFIDYTKAFDSLYFGAIWTALTQQGVNQKYINRIKNIYTKSLAKVRLEREGAEFPIKKGVRQGDPLSPKLFTAVLESIFRCLEWETKGIRVDGEQLNHLRFADDIVIFAESATELESMINELATESQKVGLLMNMTKTKILTNGIPQDITVKNENIEYVKEYIYLGQLVTFKNNTGKEIERRITLAWKKYWGLREIMKNNEIHINIKKKLYDIAILPCLTYGCQTWSLRKQDEDRVAICQRKMERSMLGLRLSDKVNNITIRNKTKIIDVRKKSRLLKWHWAGHVCRMNNTRWAKRVTEWTPRYLKRKRGRPSKRWNDIFNQRCGPLWMREARERDKWKDLGEAYAAEATTTLNI